MDEPRREEPMGGAAGGLQGWRIVVVNDDGIDAPGIELLAAAARQHSDDVWIVAPAHDQSARGRAMSHRKVVNAEARGERCYAVHGTPVDCIMIALNGLLEGPKADLVVMGTRGLSGVKHVLLGSVAERTVRTAPCPVLTVRGEGEESGARAAT